MAEHEQAKRFIQWITAGAAVVGAFVGLYGILHKPDTSVANYQRQVVATCTQVRDILAKDRSGEVLVISDKDVKFGDTASAFVVRKGPLLNVMNSNLSSTRQRFNALDQMKTPKPLAERKEAARKAWEAWLAANEAEIRTVEAHVRDGDTLARLNSITGGTQGPRGELSVNLNATLTALAGQDCTATA